MTRVACLRGPKRVGGLTSALVCVAVGLLVVRDAKERETGMIVSVTQFLKLRNELPTGTDFTSSFRNELLTPQNPISNTRHCTVQRRGCISSVSG